ncbi:MAG: IclR family transcriptional regulator [Halobacteriota archaeon]
MVDPTSPIEPSADRDLVAADETLFALIEAIRNRGVAGVTELAEDVGVSKSTVHRHLSTLLAHRYVVRADEGYRLGLRFLDLGGHVRDRFPWTDEISSKVDELASTTGELAQFVVAEHGIGTFVFRRAGSNAVRTESRVGTRVYLHHVAAGKAILSALPDETVQSIVDRWGLPPKTDRTITTEDELLETIDTVRDRGYAVDKGEHIEGLWSVGVPVCNAEGTVLGGLSVAGPTHRLTGDRFEADLPDLLRGVVNEIELNIAYA